MPQIINTNVASLNAQRNLNKSQSQLGIALQRLSSGLRINSAKDDAAGLAISDRFTTQIRGLDQAARNASDGISLSQTAESALGELTVNLQRIRELAVQSANSTNSSSDRAALNQEVQQRLAEIDRISSQTSFNGQKILDGTFGSAQFQIGANAGEVIKIDLTESLRQNAIGAIATTTSQSLGASATGGSIDVATSALDFGTTGSAATQGSLTINAGTRLFGTDATAAVAGQSGISTFSNQTNTTGDFSITALSFIGGANTQTLTTDQGTNDQTNVVFGVNATAAQIDFTVGGEAVSVNGDYSADTAGAFATFLSDINTDLTNFTATGTYGAGGTSTVTFTRNVGTQAVAVSAVNANATTAGIVASAGTGTAGTDIYDYSGAGLAQFTVDGISVVLDQDYTDIATLRGDIATQLGSGYTVAGSTTEEIVITHTDTGNVTDDDAVVIANQDANALSAGFGAGVGAAGQLARASTAATFEVDGTTITLTGNYSVGTDAANFGAFETELQGALDTAFGANVYTVVKDGEELTGEQDITDGSTGFFIRHENVTTAVEITAANISAQNAGITNDATGVTGSGAITTTNATFTIDSYAITLDQNYATFDALADALNDKLEAANAGADDTGGDRATGQYNVVNDNGTITITRNDAAGASSTAIAITVADANSTSSGFGLNVGTAGQDADITTNAQFKVDGTIVNLDRDFSTFDSDGNAVNDLRDVADYIQDQLTGYTVAADVVAGSISITNDTTGSAAVVISDLEASDTGYDAQKVTNAGTAGYLASLVGIAGTSAGEINIASGDLTIQVGDLTAVEVAGNFASVQELATYINSNVSGVFASEDTGGKLKLQSDREIKLSGDEAVGGGTTFAYANATVAVETGSLETATVATVSGSNDAIVAVDSALTRVSSLRSNFGAIQSRFESTIANLTTTSENLSAARSRILDADFAQETAALTRTQILQQAGVSILSQANSLPQLALSLLQ